MKTISKEQTVKRFWYSEESGTMKPKIYIEECPICGELPYYHSSVGGFNIYGYYWCEKDKFFATGAHQFPAIGISGFGANEQKEPQLFVVYTGEHNPEDGWNSLVNSYKEQS